MSTIILYKNNKTLRLPILKFISSNKRFDNDNSIKKESKKNEKSNDSKEIINFNKNKKVLNISTLQDLSLNSESNNISKNNSKAVQTLQTSFRDKIKISNRKRLFNILKHANVVINKEPKINEYDKNIVKSEFLYKINQKNRKKLLENYSQINHYFNNIYFKKIENNQNKIFEFSKINKIPRFRGKLNKFNLYNKINLNKTQDDPEKKIIKKDSNIANIFHNDLIISNMKRGKKLELNKENYCNNIKIRKIHRNSSLPNIIFDTNNNKIFWKENRNKLLKSNGRFTLKKIRNDFQKLK
jgi:hypothetical protein